LRAHDEQPGDRDSLAALTAGDRGLNLRLRDVTEANRVELGGAVSGLCLGRTAEGGEQKGERER
jgi:hypothetical protein